MSILWSCRIEIPWDFSLGMTGRSFFSVRVRSFLGERIDRVFFRMMRACSSESGILISASSQMSLFGVWMKVFMNSTVPKNLGMKFVLMISFFNWVCQLLHG